MIDMLDFATVKFHRVDVCGTVSVSRRPGYVLAEDSSILCTNVILGLFVSAYVKGLILVWEISRNGTLDNRQHAMKPTSLTVLILASEKCTSNEVYIMAGLHVRQKALY